MILKTYTEHEIKELSQLEDCHLNINKKDLITGQGFEADPGLKNWTIRHNVQGQFIRDENDKKN